MKATVFAGPSIFGLEPADVAMLDMRPPAACGDILRAVRDGAEAIGLIDGLFRDSPSVRHKEILAALADGIPVYGAASMGALRAAECHRFGMIGVGRIFAEYREGLRVADSDVAVAHGPAELRYRPLTEALVDVESTIGRLVQLGIIAAHEASVLYFVARQIHFMNRTWPCVVDGAGFIGRRRQAVLDAVGIRAVARKQDDARLLLAVLRDDAIRPSRSVPISRETFSRTAFFVALEKRVTEAAGQPPQAP